MGIPEFNNADEMFDYVVEHGPAISSERLEWLRELQTADALTIHLNESFSRCSAEEFNKLKAVVRQNIKLVSGDESDIELADMVGAPWDCFAEE